MDAAGAGAARSEGSTCSASSEPQSIIAQGEETLRAAELRMTDILHQFVKDVEGRIAASLKDAAGEVASHLGKEAATRLVAAERKVAFMEAELVSAKEQALSMLLRLKHHTDAQIYDLEKLLLAERKRADDAEAKVAALQDSLRRAKRKGGGESRGGKHSHSEEPAVNEPEDISDSLALIAGVACDVMQQPKDNSSDHEKNNKEEALSQSDKAENESDEAEGGDEPESPSTHINTRSRKRKSQTEQRRKEEVSAEERENSEGEDDEENDDNASAENETSSERKRPAASSRQQRKSRRKSRSVSTSEKLTRLMSGSKRARAKAGRAGDTKKPSTATLPDSSSRDSRRLMQGARQLISLAEKKW